MVLSVCQVSTYLTYIHVPNCLHIPHAAPDKDSISNAFRWRAKYRNMLTSTVHTVDIPKRCQLSQLKEFCSPKWEKSTKIIATYVLIDTLI